MTGSPRTAPGSGPRRGGLRRHRVAAGVRRSGTRPARADRARPGADARRRPGGARSLRPRDGRPDDHRLRVERQKERHLAPTLHADELWCQLFSEPGGGSDLAGVSDPGDPRRPDRGWSVTGQKVWTSNAQFASFGLMLARTDPEVPKHRGLTMFIVPMDAPGISIRPLRQISGEAEFNEVFFDGVPARERRGRRRDRRRLAAALTTLGFERFAAGFEADRLGYSAEALRGGDRIGAWSEGARYRRSADGSAGVATGAAGGAVRRLQAAERDRGGTDAWRRGGPREDHDGQNAANAANDLIVDVLGLDALREGGEWFHQRVVRPGDEVRRRQARRSCATRSASACSGCRGEPRVDKEIRP